MSLEAVDGAAKCFLKRYSATLLDYQQFAEYVSEGCIVVKPIDFSFSKFT